MEFRDSVSSKCGGKGVWLTQPVLEAEIEGGLLFIGGLIRRSVVVLNSQDLNTLPDVDGGRSIHPRFVPFWKGLTR
jgi:hypothetical protein